MAQKKATNKKRNQVIIKDSHLMEKASKREFDEIISPWASTYIVESDYGIDTLVEIVETVDINNHTPESKFFFAQLKATKNIKHSKGVISFPIEVKKIMQWLKANLPVLLVIHDQIGNKVYYLWIDNELTSKLDKDNPGWVNNLKVTVKILSTFLLNQECKKNIKDYVYDFSYSNKRYIEPGIYFKLKEKLAALLIDGQKISSDFKFESVEKSLEQISLDLDLAIYKIAISGPSRAGKSSLVNFFLKREISPTRMWQTTGVPIQILPGKEETVEIYFSDKKPTIREPFSFKLIQKYASQEFNEDNTENVRLVSIYLSNQQLERGVSFFDIPGLDDPDDNIIDYCWQTIKKSDAIIYLIDAQPAQNGGFIFRNEFKKHLQDFIVKKDKIFLVFNRIDLLDPQKILEFKENIRKTLVKLELYEQLSDKTYFIAAVDDKEKALSSEEHRDPSVKLENDIWKFLLKENKIGLVRLASICKEFMKSLESFNDILSSRLLDNEKRTNLANAIQNVRTKIPAFSKSFKTHYEGIRAIVYGSLESRKFQIIEGLETTLMSNPNNLLTSDQIQNHLTDQAYETIEITNNLYGIHLSKAKDEIDTWIETNLKQVKVILSAINKEELDAILKVCNRDNGVVMTPGKVKIKRNVFYDFLPDAYLVAAYTGARREELCNMKLSSVIEDKDGVPALIKILNYKVNHIQHRSGNNLKYHYIPISKSLNVLLQKLGYVEYKTTGEDKFLIGNDFKGNRDNMLPDILSRSFSHFNKVAGNERELSFGSLRKRYITDMEIFTKGNAMDVTGHSARQVLDQHYLDKRVLAEATKNFEVFSDNYSERSADLAEIREKNNTNSKTIER